MKELKTNYKDALHDGDLQYEITTSSGKSTIKDVTTYTQEGDQFGAADINATNLAVNRLARAISITVPASGWSSSAPYTQTVAVSEILSTDSGGFAIDTTASAYVNGTSTTRAMLKAMAGYIDEAESADGKITLICRDFKPTSDIPLVLLGA